MHRWVFAWGLVLAACGDDDVAGGDADTSGADASASNGDDTSSGASASLSASSTSGPTSADDSSSADASSTASSTTGEMLPCGCGPDEVCIEHASDACADPPTPITSCVVPPASCDGVAFACDSACGWDTCGGPGCVGMGAEVCGVPSEGIVCGGGLLTCNLFDQDCPRGEKCTSWDSNADGEYNATRCSPLSETPVAVDGVCTFEGSRFSGIDDCESGAKCFPINPDDATGICRAACEGNPYAASCADPSMTCVLEGDWFGWCLPM